MMKVLFVGARLCRNLGGPSLLVATRDLFAERLPSAEFVLMVPERSAPEDLALASTYKVSIVPYAASKQLLASAVLRAFCLRVGSGKTQASLNAYWEADVVIDLWGIAFADTLGSNSFRARLGSGLHLLIGKLARKRVIKYTADYGPLRAKWNRFFAKLYLNHCVDLVLARDEASRQHLRSLPLRTPVHVCRDTAFLLEPEQSADSRRLADLRKRQPIVGLSVSHQAMMRHEKGPSEYMSLTARFADAIVDRFAAHVVLIPNELSDGDDDDASIAEAVHQLMTQRSDATLIGRTWSAQQLKGIIQQCDVVVAARYHTLVAALSMGIPSLAIGWHHKYLGLLSLVGQERYVCDIGNLTNQQLLACFENLWASRDHEARVILGKLPNVHAAIRVGADLAASLLGSSETRKVEKKSL